ncbi:ubiquitin-associated protein 2-like isoform X1 [Myxocyprinus asiaticus]|uniref:ubiquitin-associated protein 2-like isoform X1 n=1 Tax=Myxocyprinus asiaticus TaxID=70543 RepID=UPI0022220E10|nr:ubiquitin-associated protein 2-like isoform X1 [Myxocyprinus asiaticus]
MMTSVGIERARGTRDKALPTTTQTTQPQKQLQATAEQIRLAQMIYDKNDADFEDKVKQLMEVTGQNQDDCMVALHDCNEDVNRAINFLLEGTSDATSWETVGKKKSLGKDGTSTDSKENKENREKKGERESSKGRGGASRRGRGTSRNRPVRTEENGVEPAPVERGADRGRRGRGRGHCGGAGVVERPSGERGSGKEVHLRLITVSGGRGRGRAPVNSRFTAQGMGTFNPADYTTDSGTSNSHTDVWETGASDTTDGTVAWQNTLDEWAAEDWSEDVSLSETKVFTSSCVPPSENHITPGQSLDLSSLLQKPVDREDVGGLKAVGSSQGLGHSLVFTNSHHQPARNGATSAGSNSYTHATLSSVLGSGFGELGGPKLGQTAGQQILEQLKGPGLGQLTSQPPSTGTNCTPVVGLVGTGMSVPSSSWDLKPPGNQGSVSLSSQFSREFQMQPEPSLVLSQLTQRQQGSLTQTGPLARQPSPPPLSTPSPTLGTLEAFPKAPEPPQHRDGPSMSPSQAAESQGSSTQQRQIKTQKRRIPPTSKIPSSAVEMPGSADVSGLNVQFGALDFGSESALPDFGQSENCNSEPMREATVVPQSQSSLYSKPVSESLASPVPLLLPLASSDPIYPSPSVPLPSLAPSHTTPSAVSSSSSSSAAASSAGNSFDCGKSPHSRLNFSQSKEHSGPVTNGFNGVRTSAALDTTSSSSTAKQESPSLGSSTIIAPSAPSSLLPPSVTPHSSALSSLASELSSASLPPLSSHVSSGHSSVSAVCTTSSLTYTSVDSVNSLAPSSMPFSSPSVSALPSSGVSSSVSGSNSLHVSGALGHSTNGIIPSGVRTAQLLSSSSGKAPPNLSQGVPPLLPNQYIMGPGGLLPAYPQIYGYEDLHMLQSRVPMDYYGITFPGPTATLSGRDGSLASNPYSGDITKFGRGESTSPAPTTSLSAAHAPQTAQPPQAQSQGQSQPQPQGHHNTQQAFLNAALPPGYSYTGLPYYPGMPGIPSAFQYGPTMFMPPASAKQHGMGLSNPTTPFQQPSGYGQHAFSSGYDDMTQGPAGTEYSKGYSNSSQTQAKSAANGPGKGISVTSSNSGVPDISGTVYNKTQSFDKQGFHAGTPPPFNLPSALGGTGPLTPGAAPGYAPAPFLHILPPHQQPHSQLLHHHLTQDGQGGPSQRSQSSTMQQKTQINKSNYGSSPYWGN